MKIRLQGSTLRLRMRRSEIEQLAAEGCVVETVRFADTELRYSLLLDASAPRIQAEYRPGEIRVVLPRGRGLEWCASARTSLTSEGVTPAVLIERDFVRSAVVEPDDYDRFTNPRTGRTPPPLT